MSQMSAVALPLTFADLKSSGLSEIENPILKRTLERVRLRQQNKVHAAHTTKHSSHSTHSKGSW